MTPLFSKAKDIAGVRLPDTLEVAGAELVLNGSGIRSKYFIDGYVAALYLKQKQKEAHKIIKADEVMVVRMEIVTSFITSEIMETALREGFHQASNGNLTPIQADVERFIAVFRADIHKGDRFDVLYQPGVGVEVHKNGRLELTTGGLPLKQAIFRIWLGEKPIQEKLKREMLGG